jgi:hypothetical protein
MYMEFAACRPGVRRARAHSRNDGEYLKAALLATEREVAAARQPPVHHWVEAATTCL